MFEEATNEDFRNWIQHHLDKAIDAEKRALVQLANETAAKGSFQSSYRIVRSLELAHEEFDKGVAAALGELSRVIERTELDKYELRKIAEVQLNKFIEEVKIALKPDSLRKYGGGIEKTVDEQVAALDGKLAFALRQYDVGHFDPHQPEPPGNMKNEITIQQMYGGAIQQASPGAEQSTTINVSVDDIKVALADFEAALKASDTSGAKFAEMTADIDTIKAQLSKESPSPAIVQEAGRSLRSVAEGVVAGGAASVLWKILGLG